MNGPLEPKADYRSAAAELMQLYQALRQEGFTDQQALVIIGQLLAGKRDQS